MIKSQLSHKLLEEKYKSYCGFYQYAKNAFVYFENGMCYLGQDGKIVDGEDIWYWL